MLIYAHAEKVDLSSDLSSSTEFGDMNEGYSEKRPVIVTPLSHKMTANASPGVRCLQVEQPPWTHCNKLY